MVELHNKKYYLSNLFVVREGLEKVSCFIVELNRSKDSSGSEDYRQHASFV
ncbi:hypothetical protein MOOTH_00150 [Moorella thermoacetica]|nr:hypothetical protein MOOTH_00150 [Moorella thermoacetica]